MFKRILVASCALLLSAGALSGCVSADAAIGKATESEKFRRICDAEPAVHAAFVILAPSAKLSQSVIQAEAAAHDIVYDVCRNPPANIGEALATAAEAYGRVLSINATAAKREAS